MYFLTTTLIAFEQDGEKYLTQLAIYTQIPVCTDPSCKDAQFLKRTLLQITFSGIQQLYTTFPNVWHYALLSKGGKEESLISVEEVPNSEFRIHYCTRKQAFIMLEMMCYHGLDDCEAIKRSPSKTEYVCL